jgi:hypothetical protein
MQDTELKTSADWNSIWESEFPGSFVMDPDGWDRSNWQYSWHEELITYEEFLNRVCRSTTMFSNKFLDFLTDK